MPRFTYYLPRLPGANRQMLADRGLLSRFADGSETIPHVIAGVDSGPDGQSGCLIASGEMPPAYVVKRQIWVEVKGEAHTYWVGIESDSPPGPEDLVRSIGVRGYELELGDRRRWTMPLVLRWDAPALQHVPNLPRALTPVYQDGGAVKYQSRVKRPYTELEALGNRVLAGFLQKRTVSLEAAMVDAVKLLSANYRLGEAEAGMLGLFDEVNVVNALALAVDYPALQSAAAAESVNGLEYRDPAITREDF